MLLPKIICLALKCGRNLSGKRNRGYRKCFGCYAARLRSVDTGESKAYDCSNFNFRELEQMTKRRR